MDQYEILFPSVGIVGSVYLADLPNFNSEMRNIQLMAEDLAAQLISEDDDNKGGLSGDVPPPAFHTQFIQYINKLQESSGGESKYEFIFKQLCRLIKPPSLWLVQHMYTLYTSQSRNGSFFP